MTKFLLVDCDGVMLNWMAGFKQWLAREKSIFPTGSSVTCSLADWLDCPEEVVDRLIVEFNSSRDFAELRPLAGVRLVLRNLAIHRNFKVHVITNCGVDPLTVSRRTRNIMKMFPDSIDEVRCLELGSDKSAILAGYPPSIWIEDSYKNALSGFKHGHDSIVLRWPHNEQCEIDSRSNVKWASSWLDIHGYLTNNEPLVRGRHGHSDTIRTAGQR